MPQHGPWATHDRRASGLGEEHAVALFSRSPTRCLARVFVGVVADSHVKAGSATPSVLFYMLCATASRQSARSGRSSSCTAVVAAEAVSFSDLAGLGKRHPCGGAAVRGVPASLARARRLSPASSGKVGTHLQRCHRRAELPTRSRARKIFGLLNSVVGAYYYLKVHRVFHAIHAQPEPRALRSPWPTPMNSTAMVVPRCRDRGGLSCSCSASCRVRRSTSRHGTATPGRSVEAPRRRRGSWLRRRVVLR